MNFANLNDYMNISLEGVSGNFANNIDEFIGLMTASGVSKNEITRILKQDLLQSGTFFNSLKNQSSAG